MDPELLRAMQAFWMQGQPFPAYYETGPSPNPDAPELDPFAQNVFATGAMPDVDKYGEALPYGLDTQKSLMNYQQDLYGSLADPMNAYMASTMGGEGFAPGVFGQIDKTSPIELVQTPVLRQLAASGGYQGLLASFMLPPEDGGFGDNHASAVARLKRGMNNPGEGGLNLTEDQLKQLQSELPALTGFDNLPLDTSDPKNVDWSSVTKDAQSLWAPFAAEQAKISAPGVTRDANGNYLSVEKVDSPQLEWAKKLGLPDPTARYDLEYALETDPTIRGLFQQNATDAASAEMMRKTFGEYTKKLQKQRENERLGRESDEAKKALYAKKMQDYAYRVQGAMGDYTRGMAGRGAPYNPKPINEVDIGRANMAAQYSPMHGINDVMPGSQPIIQPMTPGESQAAMAGVRAGRAPELNLPTPPEAPELSLYGRERGGLFNGQIDKIIRSMGMEPRGTTADDVAELFNKATSFLPSTFRPERQVLSGQRKPLLAASQAATKASQATNAAYIRSMLPNYMREIAGRTPAKDVVQQRLLPLYASGAYGQQGMPNAYPNRNMVAAALFGG